MLKAGFTKGWLLVGPSNDCANMGVDGSVPETGANRAAAKDGPCNDGCFSRPNSICCVCGDVTKCWFGSGLWWGLVAAGLGSLLGAGDGRTEEETAMKVAPVYAGRAVGAAGSTVAAGTELVSSSFKTETRSAGFGGGRGEGLAGVKPCIHDGWRPPKKAFAVELDEATARSVGAVVLPGRGTGRDIGGIVLGCSARTRPNHAPAVLMVRTSRLSYL